MISYGKEYPSGQFSSAVLAISSPNLLPTASLLVFLRGSWKEILNAVQALFSNSQNIAVLSTPF